MPTNRRRRARSHRPEVPPVVWMILGDEIPETGPEDRALRHEWLVHTHFYRPSQPTIRDWWGVCRERILARWIQEHPGTRPAHWWRFDAPEILRRRIGGTGTSWAERHGGAPYNHRGLPLDWITQGLADYYNGRTIEPEGRNHWNRDYHEGHFPYEGYDPQDPPTFESEAAYLARHNLLTDAERAELGPEDFEPEPLLLDGH
jgi:hypothetical protein